MRCFSEWYNSGGLTDIPLLYRVNLPAGELPAARHVAIDYDTNFGTDLVGETWKMNYSGYLLPGTPVTSFGGWTGFAIGGTSGDHPTSATTGCGVIIRADGSYEVFASGASVSGTQQLGRATVGPGVQVYNVDAVFNEVAETVTLTYVDAVGTIDMGTYETDFQNSNRYVDLRILVSSSDCTAVTRIDWRIDDLKIETIPEPDTMGLIALFGGGLLWVRRSLAI